ncbi:MAG: hypothetical protein AAFZ18_20390 [Myxococcota bacterium]
MKRSTLVISLAAVVACGDSEGDDPAVCTILTRDDVDTGGSLAAGCYLAEEDLRVSSGTLSLAAGVRIEFAQDVGLSVEMGGALRAAGTVMEPVVLTGVRTGRGAWQGLRFDNTASGENRLVGALIENGGGSAWDGGSDSQACVFLDGDAARVELRDSTLRGCAAAGLSVRSGLADIVVANSAFEDSASPLRVQPNNVKGLAGDLQFTGNDEAFVTLAGDVILDFAEVVSDNQSWLPQAIPYRAGGRISVEADLILQPGVVLEFVSDVGLLIQTDGTLRAEGTPEAPIAFRGAEATPGFWKGIINRGSFSPQNVLANVSVDSAGSSGWDGAMESRAAIYIAGGDFTRRSSLTIQSASVRFSGAIGITVTQESELTGCPNVTFEGNAGADTFVDPQGTSDCS